MKVRPHWYQGLIVLAIFDAVVVLFALELHRETVSSIGKLTESATRAEEMTVLCRRLEQGVLELNAPGNDVFVSKDIPAERRRLEIARAKLNRTMEEAENKGLNLASLKPEIDSMLVWAGRVFENLEKSKLSELDAATRARLLDKGSEAMAQMDSRQMQAIRHIGIIADRGRMDQRNFIDEHEAKLNVRIQVERYFIAFICLLLFGLLWFGYRLHRTDLELETHRRLAEEERRERLAAIGELCSSVAHGIRNPLAAIRSSAQLTLQLGKLDDASRSRLQDILSEGGRLGDRVTGLLAMAKNTSGQFEKICLQDIIQNAIKGLSPELERLGLQLLQQIPQQRIFVYGDRRQLEQLVIELISNAMEYSPVGQPINIRCERARENGHAHLVVEDSGPGVPPEVRERIFDLFFTTKPSGTGIGLATVKRIARMHHGDVELSQSSQGGACFTVMLPVASHVSREKGSPPGGSHAKSPDS